MMTSSRRRRRGHGGYAMAALLVGMSVMGVLLTAAMPTWRQMAKREREEELIFRGTQYARAIGLYQRRFANTSPPSIDVLVEQKFLRKKYKDPMVEDGEFRLLYQGSQGAATPGRATGATGAAAGGSGQSAQAGQGAAQAGSLGAAAGSGPIIGVVSKSTDASVKIYNGGTHYNEWQFVYVARTQQPGVGGAQGGRGRGAEGRSGPGTGTAPANRGAGGRGQTRGNQPGAGRAGAGEMPPPGGMAPQRSRGF